MALADYSQDFQDAFNFTMHYEVGPWYNPTDPETQAGACSTSQQQRKTGYVNVAGDHGGLTKFGIAKNANPNVDVQNLTLDKAADIYFTSYWQAGSCNQMKSPLDKVQFDAVVNHGVRTAGKMLQRAAGLPLSSIDGMVGPGTLAVVNSQDPVALSNAQLTQRSNFYNSLVQANPSQSKFLTGWLSRIASIRSSLM